MKESWKDFEFLDQPSLVNYIFYPRADDHIPADPDHIIHIDLPVENHITISCQFYFCDSSGPCVLYFHGNGELASEYEDVGMIFNGIGTNLFVADYRGYGSSGGHPSISAMMKDAQGVLKGFKSTLKKLGFNGSCFIMGRSLGSASAIELAANYPGEFNGMIIESGFCDITDLIGRLGLKSAHTENPGLDRVRRIKMPSLIIHGEYDSIVRSTEGEKVFRNLKSVDKRMTIIPDADHNSILAVGMDLYMRELKDFIQRHK